MSRLIFNDLLIIHYLQRKNKHLRFINISVTIAGMNNGETIQKVADAIKNANNILVTINRNPNVDEVAAAIGLTFVLEKLEKFTTAIFSGQIPPAAEFLNPSDTFESNMEILRDFIVTVDKAKVDRLRYKVEGDVVRIYITPYRTTLSEDDLKYESGDYNVDLLIALGAVTEQDFDDAIQGAVRILHDATVLSINNSGDAPAFATLNWSDSTETSYCEMVTDLAEMLNENEMDENTATALLTGIIAETDQFKNSKTTPKAMQIAAKLMGYGANQQLISVKLEDSASKNEAPDTPAGPTESGLSVAEVEEDLDAKEEAATINVREQNAAEAIDKTEQDLSQIAEPDEAEPAQKLNIEPPVSAASTSTPVPALSPTPPVKIESATPAPDNSAPNLTPEPTSPDATPDLPEPVAPAPAQAEVLNDLANYQAPEPATPPPPKITELPMPPIPPTPASSGGFTVEEPASENKPNLSVFPNQAALDDIKATATESLPSVNPISAPNVAPEPAPAAAQPAPANNNPFMVSANAEPNAAKQTLSDIEQGIAGGRPQPSAETPADQFKIPNQ